MDKSVVNNFTGYVEQLRNTECSQKEKIACFQHIAECIMSPSLAAHINYATHINMATTVLLLFCEDLDSVVRMSAEENLNKIFRALEKTRVSRILMDLYGEIKRNGNQRSLRICLNLFAYYSPCIREKNIKWYAIRLLPCLQTIAQRKETQLGETLCEFVKSFGQYLQMGLTDSEVCKLFEVFLANIGADCAVKRRCSAQNCISLIENSRNKSLMAKHGLNKAIDLLLNDQQNSTVLGVLGFLRLLLPLIIHGFRYDYGDETDDDTPAAAHMPTTTTNKKSTKSSSGVQQQQQKTSAASAISNECRQIIEIYDYCLHLLSTSYTSNHSTINAALEVINAVLQALDSADNSSSRTPSGCGVVARSLQQLLSNQQLQHAEYLRRRKSLKNQIFQLRNYEVASSDAVGATSGGDDGLLLSAARCQGAGGAAASEEHSTTTATSAKIINVTGDDDDGDGNCDYELALAHKLQMQNVANAKITQQQRQKREQRLWEVASVEAFMTAQRELEVGIGGVSGADERHVVDDVDLADNVDDEGHVASTSRQQKLKHQQQQQRDQQLQSAHMRLAARSISECVVDDEAGAADLLAAAAHTDVEADDDDDDDDDDEDDFTTLSAINEPQKQQRRQQTTYTLTTTIDVDNLIDAIDAANITDATNAAKTSTQLHEQPQNLLTPMGNAAAGSSSGGEVGSDDKSQHLSDIDNESFNSIDFEAEITIAGTGANANSSTTGNTATTAAGTTGATAGTGTGTVAAKTNVWRGGDEGAGDAGGGGKSNSDTIGSFFNNLISNAASDSVSKLFRPTAATRSTPIKSARPGDKSMDMVSVTSTPTSAAPDSLSIISNTSSGASKRDQVSSSAYLQSPSIASSSLGMHDDTPSTAVLADMVGGSFVSTLGSEDETDASQRAENENADVEMRRIPNVNPFLSENSPLKQNASGLSLLTLKIGTVYEQPIIFYTARLIAARFLLSGQPSDLQSDSLIRISIKSLSLGVLSHCVRNAPTVLHLSLEITESELRALDSKAVLSEETDSSKSSSGSGSPCMPHSECSSASSNLGKDYEHLDARGDLVDFAKKSPFDSGATSHLNTSDLPADSLLLDIKYDHFGPSTCDYLLQPTSELSKSADPVLLSQQVGGAKAKTKKAFESLSKSDIIETPSRRKTTSMIKVTEALEDAPPQMLPPRPPKRTKSLRKSTMAATATVATLTQIEEQSKLKFSQAVSAPTQQMSDVLLYYNHADPMLRGGVQQIIGSFIESTEAGVKMPLEVNFQHLLAMLLKGLQDDIHTVVIQALNAFDKIFPYVVSKYLMTATACQQHHDEEQQKGGHKQGIPTAGNSASKCQNNAAGQIAHKQQQFKEGDKEICTNDANWPAAASATFACLIAATTTATRTCPRTPFNDNDELIAALLNDFQLQSKSKYTTEPTQTTSTASATITTLAAVGTFSISPKLLLSKLRLCYYNKYWLVQNKYAEVISNLNYMDLRAYCRHNSNDMMGHDVNATLAATSTTPRVAIEEEADERGIVCAYEAQFLDELLQLIGDNDFRVREHSAQCLCRFIIKNAQQQQQKKQRRKSTTNAMRDNESPKHGSTSKNNESQPTLNATTYETNFNLLWDFLDYRVFSSMSPPLRNVFRANATMPPPLAASADGATNATTLSSGTSSLSSSPWSGGGAAASGAAFGGRHANWFAEAIAARQMGEEQKILAKVLYRMTNKLMALNDKNVQFGIIYTLRVLLQHFNFIDYQRAWMEFNLMEICLRFSYYNYTTAVDLSCQNDLIDVTGKLMAGYFVVLSSAPVEQQQHQLSTNQQQLDQLLTHIMKLLNIYYHVFGNQKPLLFAKVQKSDLFANARELALVQSVGYFGNDYVYIKLYNILRSANDSYKISINQESGRLLISLLRTCLNTLSLCIELRSHTAVAATTSSGTPTHSASSSTDAAFPSSAALKLIEEILQYLGKLVNYAPGECIACLRQLLKYLFGQNYGNRARDYCGTFVRPYLMARRSGQQWGSNAADDNNRQTQQQDDEATINSSVVTQPASKAATSTAKTRPVVATMAAAALASATARVTATATAIGTATSSAMGRTAATAATTRPARTGGMTTMTSTMSATSSNATNNEQQDLIGMQTSQISSETQYYRLLGELFASELKLNACKSEYESECIRHIKLFEPLVIHCLMLFLKSSAKVQAPILELLSQLLDLNVTYSVLDSKNVIFDQIINNLDLIENGIARNGHIIIPSMIRFLVQITHKSDRKLITIPKIISITNNLLANNAVRDCSVLALKTLSYELFFMSPLGNAAPSAFTDYRAPFQSPIARSPLGTPIQQHRHAAEDADAAAAAAEALLASRRELDTQKEVVLGMLEKFLDASQSQLVIGLLLLRERSAQQLSTDKGEERKAEDAVEQKKVGCTLESTLLQDASAVYAMISRSMCEGRIVVYNWNDFWLLETCFKNYEKNVLANSKDFLVLLQLFITKDVTNFSDLSYATIVLANVILKTEEIYLVNHIKLYLKNHPAAEERALCAQRARQQERQQHQPAQQQQQHWLLDGPSTSSAAAALAAAFATLPSVSAAGLSEINYFAQVLCEKLVACFDCLIADALFGELNVAYCRLVTRFVAAVHAVCCRSRHKDALQSVFRLTLAESEFLNKYYSFVAAATPTVSSHNDTNNEGCSAKAAPISQLQLEVFKLLSGMKLLDSWVLLQLHRPQKQQQQQQKQMLSLMNEEVSGDVKWRLVQRTLLHEICEQNPNPSQWTAQQVQQLLNATSTGVAAEAGGGPGDGEFLNFLIADNFAFVCDLCEVNAEFCSLWQRTLLQHASALNKHSIRVLGPLVLRLCRGSYNSSREFIVNCLQLLLRLHALHTDDRALQTRLERLARRLVTACAVPSSELQEELLQSAECSVASFGQSFIKELAENQQQTIQQEQQQHRIIDEKWLLTQLIKFSTQPEYQEPQQLARILLEIQSEHKLHNIFNSCAFDVARVLRHAITSSLMTMLATFRNNCIQHNPHIHYMQPNPLARVCCVVLMTRIAALVAGNDIAATVGDSITTTGIPTAEEERKKVEDSVYLCGAVIALIECIKKIETTALVYIEARFIEKFVHEHLLRPECIATLLSFLSWCCDRTEQLLLLHANTQEQQLVGAVGTLLHCIEVLLQEKCIWNELNQTEKLTAPYVAHTDSTTTTTTATASTIQLGCILTLQERNVLLCRVLDVLVLAATQTLQNTIFYKRYKALQASVFGEGAEQQKTVKQTLAQLEQGQHSGGGDAADVAALLIHTYAPKAVFLAKLIEAKMSNGGSRKGELSTSYITGGDGVAGDVNIAGGSGGGGGSGAGLRGVATSNEMVMDFENGSGTMHIQMRIFESIGIALLRTNQFYAFAVTPFEIIQQQQREEHIRKQSPMKQSSANAAAANTIAPALTPSGKLPTIPVESLSDVDILRKFVKRLSIFGFTTRQQFEEYFMTFLLLINKAYDENMVDEQEQFLIKSTCLEAILELLITYKTFPIVGNKLSHFHHTTRWSRINCDSISLKKLHKVQLLVSASNVFYQPNLERGLGVDRNGAPLNNIIGTVDFDINQYDLNFVWQQMEAYAQLTTAADASSDTSDVESPSTGTLKSAGSSTTKAVGGALREDTATKNYCYFTSQSGIDFKSSTQLIFDVLMQIIEYNHILVLPNLVKFCTICESREQIKWIKDKALKLQETIPMDDTISHQHLIYLVCKTQAMLIPTLGELQQLCTLIGNYLKSSHIFIRNATLAGVLCLLECCSKTNPSIGKLSEELALLRELIVGYINRNGIIDTSGMQCSDIHSKLVWTLNYCLIEWTSKFVPQCHLLSNTVIAASNFLRKTSNEDVYLCVLYGLERMVVIGSGGSNGNGSSSNLIGGSAANVNGFVTPALRAKIEKLALDLVKLDNEKFSIPALQLLLSCIYVGSAKQLENTELSNGIVQDDPEIIAQQTDKVDTLLHCIKSSTRDAAWIYGQVLCQIIRDLVPPNEILTKVIKEFLAINQPHCDVVAMIVYQVFRCAIDSSYLQVLQDWLICSLPTFLSLPEQKGVWCLSVIFLSASINLHLIKLFPVLLGAREFRKLGQHEIALFVTAAQDFHAKLSAEQRMRFRDAFEKFHENQLYAKMLHSLW